MQPEFDFYTPKYFNTYKKCADYGREEFYDILYHELPGRSGYVIQAAFENGECKKITSCNKIEGLKDKLWIGYTPDRMTTNFYTSVNVFNNGKRISENMRFRTAFYIDIDIHSPNGEQDWFLDVKKTETQKVIENAFDDGKLPIPTMIVDTGRGFALYYVLKNSIANVPNAAKIHSFFDLVYDKLILKYREVLLAAKNDMVGSVDPRVKDVSRLCRIPGTHNPNNGEICKVTYINRSCENNEYVYFDLSDITPYIFTGKKPQYKNASKSTTQNVSTLPNSDSTSYPIQGICNSRLKALELLRDLRGDRCVDNCREQMLFILYNILIPMVGKKNAGEKLAEFNNKFVIPLKNTELDHIIEGAERVISKDGHTGFYKLRTKFIIDTLNISDEELEVIGLGVCKRQLEREAKRNEKTKRNAQIEQLLKNTGSESMTYYEIAEICNVSERTVKRLAKQLGITRHSYPTAVNSSVNAESANSAARSIVSVFSTSITECCAEPIYEGKSNNADNRNLEEDYEADNVNTEEVAFYNNENNPNLKNAIHGIDIKAFWNTWNAILYDTGWAGEKLLEKLEQVLDIADERKWNLTDLADHMNKNIGLYKNWEETYVISAEQKWLEGYLRDKKKVSWNGPEKKKAKETSLKGRTGSTFIVDRRFYGITVKRYPWLDTRWLKVVMNVFRSEWGVSTYKIDGEEIEGKYVDTCFHNMEHDDIVELLHRLCCCDAKIEKPYAYIVKAVYKMKNYLLKDKDTCIIKYDPESYEEKCKGTYLVAIGNDKNVDAENNNIENDKDDSLRLIEEYMGITLEEFAAQNKSLVG